MMKLLVSRPQRSPRMVYQQIERNFRSIHWSQHVAQLLSLIFWSGCLELMAIHHKNAGCVLAEGHTIPHIRIFWDFPKVPIYVSRRMWNEAVLCDVSLSAMPTAIANPSHLSLNLMEKKGCFLSFSETICHWFSLNLIAYFQVLSPVNVYLKPTLHKHPSFLGFIYILIAGLC